MSRIEARLEELGVSTSLWPVDRRAARPWRHRTAVKPLPSGVIPEHWPRRRRRPSWPRKSIWSRIPPTRPRD